MNSYNLEKNYISLEQKDLLLQFLSDNLDLHFQEYSESSVRRRISKILSELNLQTVEEYIKYLQRTENPREEFLERFTVNVTEMFRDPYFYSVIINEIEKHVEEKGSIKIWSAGCSSGEETLSLAILLKERNLLDKVSITGTDLSTSILKKAQSRTYKLRHMEYYHQAYREAGGKYDLEKYFEVNGENVIFDSDLCRPITFLENDLTTLPPSNDFDFVICRNVLIYFNAQLQDTILNKFTNSLNDNGYLALGSKESLIFFQGRDVFIEVEPESRIYKKVR